LKVYLTASESERGRRRSGENGAALADTVADLVRRDKYDSSRAASPLRQADDAVVLDSTSMDIDEVVDKLRAMVDGAVRR
jgi:cytidylate kinase